MKLTSLLSVVFAALVASPVAGRSCTKADWEAVEKATHESPLSAACAADMNMPLGDFFAHKQPTAEQNKAFDESSNCKELYAEMQAASIAQHCSELEVFKYVTWEMVVALMDVGAYPKTSTHCDRAAIKEAFSHLLLNNNLVACLTTTGLYSSVVTHKIPTVHELAIVANTTSCADFYDEAQALLKEQPHCTMEKGAKGRDIHAVESVSFSVFVQWMQVLTMIHTKHVVPTALSLALSMWEIQDHTSPTHPSQAIVIAQSVFTGAAMAFIGMFIFARWRRASEEARGLLRPSYM
ncbi:unnamed protein product [Aphanomyces euteiches]|uniref:Uncharacterized protein n=1 Tax=Aphanomyces euteiches TaxID=100861 RepID=A0A6G0XVU1_9STRA|nr:hypothetical protein Ae201684_001234 [Aphanomyces euteiches]KAH9099759.1 hypothetical protein Ae201684P_018769 [Aphanomyces euteiches]KAH9101459.1 hypothetical protein AeMF1_021819 [Aphanomyces euteiches]KAH9147068.1 hypothetical protein LEN26_004801 [Aphanomyces euteiches]KAH9151700.1 hypothetical protein AeRB84_005736 [Aphanomyces euteiches]